MPDRAKLLTLKIDTHGGVLEGGSEMSKIGGSDSKNSLYCSFCGKSQHQVRNSLPDRPSTLKAHVHLTRTPSRKRRTAAWTRFSVASRVRG